MGIDTSFHLIYGYRLTDDLKSRTTGEALDPFSEKLEPYLNGEESVQPFTLLWDQMGSGQDMVFGKQFCDLSGYEASIMEVDIDRLEKDKLKKLYSGLFEDFDVPDVEPKLLCITHQS